MTEVKGVLKWRHAVLREILEDEARESFWGGRHPYWYPGKRKVVTSRSTAETILERFLKSAKERKKGGGGRGK